MSISLGNSLSKGGMTGPTIVSDGLVLKHNYDAGAVVPVSDGAVSFDGIDNYIAITTPSVFNGETLNSFNASIAGWAKFNTIGQYEAIISIGTFDFEIAPTSSTAVGIWVNNAAYGGSTYTPTLNTWNHYAATKDGNTYKLYVDGVLIGTGTDADNATVASTSSIGSNDGSSEFFDGYICNAAMWSGVLTQAQIKSIMWKNYAGLTDSDKDAGTTGSSNLVSWWNLGSIATGSDGSYVRDYHYGGNSSELGSEIYTTNNALSSQPYEADDGSTNITLNSGTFARTVYTPTANIGKFSLKMDGINATNDRMSTSFSTTSGKLYEISFYMKLSQGVYNTAEHGAQETYLFKVGTSDNDATNASIALLDIFTLSYGSLTSSTRDWYNYKVRFKASASTSHFTFIKTDALGTSLSTFMYFDDFSVKEVIGNPGDLQ